MQPTRQEMLDAINMKIARTGGGTGPGETGYYLPMYYVDITEKFPFNTREIFSLWGSHTKPLNEQKNKCISYIYNLLSHE